MPTEFPYVQYNVTFCTSPHPLSGGFRVEKLVKKSFAFYETRIFLNLITAVSHSDELYWRKVQYTVRKFFKIAETV